VAHENALIARGFLKHTQALLASERGAAWLRALLVGLGLYVVGIAVLILTGNPNLFPTVVMLGNFLIPVTYVVFFFERGHLDQNRLPATALAFVVGGVLGVFAAALLEPLFIRRLDVLTAFAVGLIEEFAKILGLLAVVRRTRFTSPLDGLIFGAAAGMGFAALESSGYAFSAFLRTGGSLSFTVGLTLLRGFLAPVGHGTWTAIAGEALFRSRQAGRHLLSRPVVAAYLTVAVLHGLWDGLPGLLMAVVGPGPDILLGELVVAGVGFGILARRWREAVRRQETPAG
jgi:RsiW-degrading membrane proteinase PrsW (M82 family)